MTPSSLVNLIQHARRTHASGLRLKEAASKEGEDILLT